ncbi:MAG: ABC transporter permease [Lachnospiraceae bacterium]|jgi:ribose transport system permease protein|nr:ABC transporter permease [Lachnospiraceae bacterium]MEE3377642.1 ABC transporter permease [Lachnospiraceae bacterium]MEE3456475.1 ABC transporter permease [Lachnospiraceae bacterium]
MKNVNVKDLVKSNAIWLVFIAEVIIFSIASGGTFITGNNIVNISRQVSYYGIASIGMTFVILIAGIDLSIGSIITIVNVVCAYLMVNAGMNMWVAVIISLLLATAIGTLNGGMVATIGIPALIATFASQTIFEGISYLISGGRPISGFTSDFGLFGRWAVGPVPVCALIMIACFALGSFILNKSYFGRYFYAIGGNEEAAELSGIRVNRVKYLIYALSGFFAGLAGIVLLSRSGSAQSTVGKGLEFDVITCVVLGGVSVNGGVGRMSGVVAGVLIIGSLTNGMILMDVSEYTQMVVKGLVLAVAVGIDCMSKKHQAS